MQMISCVILAPMSYASVCRGTDDTIDPSNMIEQLSISAPPFTPQSLCPYAEKEGICEALETGRYCPYIHGDLCDLCEMPALHPFDERQREQHRSVKKISDGFENDSMKVSFRNVYRNMKQSVKKRSLFNAVRIKYVAFAWKSCGIEMVTNDLEFWKIASIFSAWNVSGNGVHHPTMNTKLSKLGKQKERKSFLFIIDRLVFQSGMSNEIRFCHTN